MGLFKKKGKNYTIVLPSGKEVTISGDEEAIVEFTYFLEQLIANLAQQEEEVDHEHEWLDGLVCYQMFHSEPRRFQLMCRECGMWVDVDQTTWQRYVAKEVHREHIEQDKADREAEAVRDLLQPVYDHWD